MSIICYFGVPRSGKSTVLTKIARRELKRKTYKHIYTVNIDIKGCKRITKQDFEKYKFFDSLILWDEITLDYDNRGFKFFSDEAKESFILHGHFGNDIIYATQNFELVDKKIRDLTLELWYMSKSVVPLLREFTISRRIYRQININEHTSDLTLGYRFCNAIERLFVSNTKFVFRRKYYKYFNSFDELQMEGREVYEE